MSDKYTIDTPENKAFLSENARRLLEFGRRFPSPGGGSYYLGDDGTPWTERPRETWITCRMAHVYSIGHMMGVPGCKELAEAAVKGLLGELYDGKNGGWFAGINPDGTPLPNKQCYAHAFVILAASSAVLAGIKDAEKLLNMAALTYDRYFWNEETGLAVDTWNTEFSELDTYRGLNANMHTVEAFLAIADAMDIIYADSPKAEDTAGLQSFLPSENKEKPGHVYRLRAGRIINHVVGWANENNYRLPEHFTEDWKPDYDMNKDKPDDPFKPYGATPGHGIEWARLISQWCLATKRIEHLDNACALYERAVKDAWDADGAEGLVYTTDWDGSPVVHDRMHWTLAEAINTSAVLYRITGNEKYSHDYSRFMKYLDETVLDHETGSWFHQLDETNKLKGTVWPGKSDLYHAFQSMLIPYSPIDLSIATAVRKKSEE